MSATHPELKQIFWVVFSIITNGRENKSLGCVSPPCAPTMRSRWCCAPQILPQQSKLSPEACASRYKASESGGSSLSKSAGSKVSREQSNRLFMILIFFSRKFTWALALQLNLRLPPREVRRPPRLRRRDRSANSRPHPQWTNL